MKIAIIGLGASGLFCLHALKGINAEIHVYDRGPHFSKLKPCPIDKGILEKCPPIVPCNPCTPAIKGGTWNDFKVITSASAVIGGRLCDLIGPEQLQRQLDKVKAIIKANCNVEIPEVVPETCDLMWISKKLQGSGFKFHPQTLLHCGSDNALDINTSILDSCNGSNIEFLWNHKVTEVYKEEEGSWYVASEPFSVPKWGYTQAFGDRYDICIISTGRAGASWLVKQPFYKDLQVTPGQVDIGVRVETLKQYTEELDIRFYEPKISMETSKYKDQVRNFCSNPGGYVTPEHHGDYVLVNGHSKMFEKSENNNFAVLMSQRFTKPFKNPQLYSQNIARATNMLAGGGPLVQRFGDLLLGKRTKSLVGNSVVPTLTAECGDISLAYPYRILEGIIEYLEEMDLLFPGIASADTLLYAPEIKSYPDYISVDQNMLTNLEGLFIIGDVSSWTRSVGQSAVSGMLAAQGVIDRLK